MGASGGRNQYFSYFFPISGRRPETYSVAGQRDRKSLSYFVFFGVRGFVAGCHDQKPSRLASANPSSYPLDFRGWSSKISCFTRFWRATHSCDCSDQLQGVPGPPGPKCQKSLKKVVPGPTGPECQKSAQKVEKVTKKSLFGTFS